MKDLLLGQEPAYPALEHNESGYGDQITLYLGGQRQYIPFTKGMSKRYVTAKDLLAGMLSNNNYRDSDSHTHKEELVALCYGLTDELLKQENETNN